MRLTEIINMKVSNNNLRAEARFDNYIFVRSLGTEKAGTEANHGAIDAILKPRAYKKCLTILENVGDKTFSQVWGEMNKVKGANFKYKSY